MINVFYSDLGYYLYNESPPLDEVTFMGIFGMQKNFKLVFLY